ncbi:hypothetical protein J0X14_05330 [Muricauda sp. CAU 1633]|uniref:hypothetical protein n=1 Tax=Allomuricauda sp. CAU 1633 TaxID=2816036 RepID=UPI001A8F69FB|nr:hypothetical protein [Muricauda sp. CAU 1633]MBO0321708.1 hypothetical protein [Muricauda sp. CAU 1633]
MKKKIVFTLVFVLVTSMAMKGQLNEYKYIIVPKKFETFKKENQYMTSTMVKHLFTQKGFTPVYDDALPEDLANNRCLGLLASLSDDSSMFSTKVTVILKNCQSIEVYRTMEGKSKVKEYTGAYKDALENAFTSFDAMDYAYTPKKSEVKEVAEQPITVSFKDDVKKLDEEPQTTMVVKQEATLENQSYESIEPKSSTYTQPSVKSVQPTSTVSGLLYAQPIDNGYQLVDSTPKVVMKLMSTSMENVFLTDYQGNSGMVMQKDGKWFLEYAEGGEKKLKELNIKF